MAPTLEVSLCWILSFNLRLEAAESGQKWPGKEISVSCPCGCCGNEPQSTSGVHLTCETLRALLDVGFIYGIRDV